MPLAFVRYGDEWKWATFAILGCGIIALFGRYRAINLDAIRTTTSKISFFNIFEKQKILVLNKI